MVELNAWPVMVKIVNIKTGSQCSSKELGLISIPTDTKNTAPNKSFTGLTKCSMCSACVVSAMIEPMMKAPSAGENPTLAANITISKHNAIEMISIISSVNKCLARLSSVGIKKMPPTNQMIKKNASLNTDIISTLHENWRLTAIVDSKTIIKMASKSCTINEPMTFPANRCALTPSSSKVLTMIVVDEMDSITPRKIQSMVSQCIIFPTLYPSTSITTICVMAVTDAVPPTFINFLKLNSSPRLNNKKITPISAQTSTLFISVTDGKKSKWLPAK